MSRTWKSVAFLLTSVGGLLTTAAPARADLILNLSQQINGSPAMLVNPGDPTLTATFHTVSSGDVLVTIGASNLTSGEFVNDLVFNVDPKITPSSLSFTYVSGAMAAVAATTDDAQTGGNQVKGGLFDVAFTYGNNVLTSSTPTSVYEIKFAGITENSFNFLSADGGNKNGSGGYTSAADIRGIPASGGGTTSGSVGSIRAVPEPASLGLLAAGAAGLAGFVRRRSGK